MLFNPLQLQIRQPRVRPIMPKRAVDAPAFSCNRFWLLVVTKENMLPPIPDRIYMINVLMGPQVYSILVTSIKMEKILEIMCRKLTCKNMALISLQTSPLETAQTWLAPNLKSESQFISNKLPSLFMPSAIQAENNAILATISKTVKERQLKLGQKVSTSMLQQVSSLGFLMTVPPETSKTRFSCAYLICYYVVMGGISSIFPSQLGWLLGLP